MQRESAATTAKSVTSPNKRVKSHRLTVCLHGETLSESAIWVLPDHDHLCFSSALQLKPTGSICRAKSGDCDLEEFCTGFSASCPTDAFTQNGLTCNRGRGYCYNGQCPSRLQHCRRLWGPGKSPANVLLVFPRLGGIVTLAAVWFVSLIRGSSGSRCLLPPTWKLQEDLVQPEMFQPVIHESKF